MDFTEWLLKRSTRRAPKPPKPKIASLPEELRERMRLYMREYRAANRERINAQQRVRYRQRQEPKNRMPVHICACGRKIRGPTFYRHAKVCAAMSKFPSGFSLKEER